MPPHQPATAWAAWDWRAGGRALDIVLPPRCLKCGATVDSRWARCAPSRWPPCTLLAPPQACLRRAVRIRSRARPLSAALCAGSVRCSSAPGRPSATRGASRPDPALQACRPHGSPARPRALDGVRRRCAIGRCRTSSRRCRCIGCGCSCSAHNQAALLASALAPLAGKPAVNDLLQRRRRTPLQGGGVLARQRNVAGASLSIRGGGRACRTSACSGRRRPDHWRDHVSACASVLLRAGARAVDVLTLARVVRTGG